ncbi:hypothetical protein PV05_08852 [Exophiala xenobiotica]|uniref:SET domain-containing protein n=1 Tax=Exophiala xenobiotica TaxID=348802 RepID=A0A0D2ED03_9EURO|nr:uncharacterized protein PV05_08852 [Exophiala xenobiotica]KIW53263.1 hypothetical protein PV05_08852 [Exophiala xenobiotica]
MSPSLPTASNARPTSSFFEVRTTATSGRGVFALIDIPRDTLLLETSLVAASAIYKPYAKEVCAQCFSYDRGVLWKIRDNARSVVFCSESCQTNWTTDMPPAALVAREEVQNLLARKQKLWDTEIEDFSKPSPEAIDKAWTAAEDKATLIRAARSIPSPTKAQLKALRQAQSLHPDPDTIWFLLDAVIQSIRQHDIVEVTADLAADSQAFINADDLNLHVDAYLSLLSIIPHKLLPHIQPSLLRTIQSRTTHNSFGLRSLDEGGELGTAGSECFGFGVWPAASYWNHSCKPNLTKQRNGRTWKFWTSRDIRAGEELCISYLGGDERDMDTAERREKLTRIWGFECQCERCSRSATVGQS